MTSIQRYQQNANVLQCYDNLPSSGIAIAGPAGVGGGGTSLTMPCFDNSQFTTSHRKGGFSNM